MRNKTLIAALAACALIAIGCGSDPEVTTGSGTGNAADAAKEADRAPTTVAMGKAITVNANGIKATYTLSKPTIKTSGQFGIAPQNGAWLLLFLRVDVSKGEAFTCSCDISLVEKDGKVHDFGAGGIDGYPDFQATQVKAGQHADGWVVFDLPEGTINGSKAQLKVQALFGDSAYGYWTVKA